MPVQHLLDFFSDGCLLEHRRRRALSDNPTR
jgi:hypothetical protein